MTSFKDVKRGEAFQYTWENRKGDDWSLIYVRDSVCINGKNAMVIVSNDDLVREFGDDYAVGGKSSFSETRDVELIDMKGIKWTT